MGLTRTFLYVYCKADLTNKEVLMRTGKYIGVTGFMHRSEVDAALEVFSCDQRKLMIGVLASNKTIGGQSNKWPGRYPLCENIIHIFPPRSDQTFNVVHFASDDLYNLWPDLTYIRFEGGDRIDGIQLNMVWPDDVIVESLIAEGIEVIVQVNAHAIGVCKSFNEVMNRLERYPGAHVLFDMSGGHGVPLDKQKVIHFLQACYYNPNLRSLHFGVAGGLSADRLNEVADLFAKFPQLSVDAEGQLRNPDDDSMNIAAMQDYLVVAQAVV